MVIRPTVLSTTYGAGIGARASNGRVPPPRHISTVGHNHVSRVSPGYILLPLLELHRPLEAHRVVTAEVRHRRGGQAVEGKGVRAGKVAGPDIGKASSHATRSFYHLTPRLPASMLGSTGRATDRAATASHPCRRHAANRRCSPATPARPPGAIGELPSALLHSEAIPLKASRAWVAEVIQPAQTQVLVPEGIPPSLVILKQTYLSMWEAVGLGKEVAARYIVVQGSGCAAHRHGAGPPLRSMEYCLVCQDTVPDRNAWLYLASFGPLVEAGDYDPVGVTLDSRVQVVA